jgi:large subunit ribosomal protein L19
VSKELLKKASESSLRAEVPSFRVGDTVNVSTRIVEGEKERIQIFRGTVIRRTGGGVSETFTVRRIVNNEGVERTFPLHSPTVVGVEVVRSGKTRRSKLYFLRKRVGKATRLRDVAAEGAAKAKRAHEANRADQPAQEPQEEGTKEG